MNAMASQITGVSIFARSFVRAQIKETSKLRVTGLCGGIHRWPVDSPYKGLVTQKMFPFDDVIMVYSFPWDDTLVKFGSIYIDFY